MEIILAVIAAVSATLAIVAVFIGISTAREARQNFQRTKDVLATIETKASLIEQMVSNN